MEVMEAMADAPGYSAIRAMMRILVEKGLLKHRREGLKYTFEPVVAASEARTSAVAHLVRSLFNGSAASVVAALLDARDFKITPEEIQQLKELIAEKEGKKGRK